MFNETVRESTKAGIRFTDLLRSRGMHCGITVDTFQVPISGTDGETLTQGMDSLDKRCQMYYKLGVRFAKWRAVFKIGNGLPSKVAILENSKQLAKFGKICQANGLVPIIETEILQDGSHTIE
jgi:fructose-bisphosphate aldolase class I